MEANRYHVLGVMSGTSLDGVDLAYIRFEKGKDWKFEILKASTIAYSEAWKQRLKQAVSFSAQELKLLDDDYTQLLANIISTFIQQHSIKDLEAVCSHGHTILHQPQRGITYQIGNLPQLATLIGETVVCDFRLQDVQLGGQGAPLVPIGDRLLFSKYDYCLNLGGFANISFEENGERIAFDICPANIVLNFYAEKLGMEYDKGGKTAASGVMNESLLKQLNTLQFYEEPAPKSLGLEWVQEHIFPKIEASKENIPNILRTFTEHVAIQIAKNLKGNSSLLVTGGGVYNAFLIDRLNSHSSVNVVIPKKTIVEYKEALVFALLGILKLRGEINCLKSVTGASKDHSSGKIFKP